MKAMILCAGYGTRLGDLTKDLPKPLLRAGEHALVDYILWNLKQHGFGDVIINLHHQADKIREALRPWQNRGVSISYSFENELLGTAGAVKKAEAFFANEEAFLVHYGDVVTDVDLAKMMEFHKKCGALGTVLVHERKRSNSALRFDRDFCVQEFVERPPEAFWENIDKTWVNSGIMVFSPEVLKWIPESGPSDWPRDLFPRLIASRRLFAHCLEGYRIAVDSTERLTQLEDDIGVRQFEAQID